jgi:tetratricopeptide (TPR) repeat protein
VSNIETKPSTAKLIPDDWDHNIHQQWISGDQQNAIKAAVDKLNTFSENKPKSVLIQLAYYLFLLNDFSSASVIFKDAYRLYPDDNEILINLCVSLSRAKQDKEAITYLKILLKKDSLNFVAWDSLASAYSRLGDYEKSTKSGTNALTIKDKKYGNPDASWTLPAEDIKAFTANKKRVIAFSLWGNEKRYIFGALRNLLLAPDIFPEWELWFYVDNSVSSGFIEIIKSLGGKVLIQKNNQPLRDKLCWRFNVANHAEVGYFLIRDIDSVFSVRECQAVQEWLNSGKWFHIIRDWWTHTDLILACLWGGVAGALPDIQEQLQKYSPNAVTTPNIDQWFLRDRIWRYVKTNCLIHDRCFKHGNAQAIPGIIPEGNIHIGACEYHQRPEFQEKILSAWIKQGRTE